MEKRGLFPGTFDPFTKGHEATVNQALQLFDKVIVAVGVNPDKKTLFSSDQRVKWIQDVFHNNPKVEVVEISGIVAEYCKNNGIISLVRGLRNGIDFQYEYDLAQANKTFFGVETVFLPAHPQLIAVSSSVVRELYRYGMDASAYLPEAVKLS